MYRVRVLGVERLHNSANGNPKWRLTLQDEAGGMVYQRNTPKDAAVGHLISESMEGCLVNAAVDGRGSLVAFDKTTEE